MARDAETAIDKPESSELPEDSGAVTGAYTEGEAEDIRARGGSGAP